MFVKKLLAIAIVSLCAFTYINVDALTSDDYYTNDNGVSLTKEEYDFLSTVFFEGYQDFMTVDDYNWFQESKIMEGEIETKTVYDKDLISPRSASHLTSYKELKITKSCTTDCTILTSLTWLKNPAVRSYDVIGAYLDGTTRTTAVSTDLYYGNTVKEITDLKTATNGVGSSLKLPSSGSNIRITQIFSVKKGGHVYASYQHASKTSTLAISKDYTFSKSGIGGVFKFSSKSEDYYDLMLGVDIAV